MEGKKASEVKKIKMQTVNIKIQNASLRNQEKSSIIQSGNISINKRGNKGGFTIIETLVAVTVLMIAVSGPLVVASKGLTTALYARDQVIASYLAQETMEMIKNIRDNNLGAVNNPKAWLTSIRGNDQCQDASDACVVGPFSTAYSICVPTTCAVHYDKLTGYTHNTNASKTIFKRYYYLTAPGVEDYCISTATECQVHVVVSWNEGTVPYDVTLTSELVNNLR